MAKVTIMGAGTWGTALGVLLHDNGHEVMMWCYEDSQAKSLQETYAHPNLPEVSLEGLSFTSSYEDALKEFDLVVMAVPSTATRSTCEKMKPFMKEGDRVIVVSKGIEEETLFIQTQIIEDVLPFVVCGALSGPTHAEEVSRRMPTAIVAGSSHKELSLYVQELFMNEYFRVYVSDDVLGMELGGSLKNVIALAAGMSDGLGFGDNAKAALITRGVYEITSLAVAMGAKRETLNGLTGIGDLIVTCGSMHSRNRRAGILMGQGKSLKEAVDEVQMVVEGVYSAKSALMLGEKYGVDLPIIQVVNKVLFSDMPAKDGVMALMLRDKKSEF